MSIQLMGKTYEVRPEMASCGVYVCTKFHEDWYRRSSNIKTFTPLCERL
jgi:hypothetical protein